MKLTGHICDICGKQRGKPYDHAKCSAIRKARGGVKETIASSRPDRKSIKYLSHTGI